MSLLFSRAEDLHTLVRYPFQSAAFPRGLLILHIEENVIHRTPLPGGKQKG